MKKNLRIAATALFILIAPQLFAEVLIELDKDIYRSGDVVRITVRGLQMNELALIRWVDARGNVQKQSFVRRGREDSILSEIRLEVPTTVYNEIVVRAGSTEKVAPFKVIMPVRGWLDYYPIVEIGDEMPKKGVLDNARGAGVKIALPRNRKLADAVTKNALRLLYLYSLNPRDFYPKEDAYKALIESYKSAVNLPALQRQPSLDARSAPVWQGELARNIDKDYVNRPFGFLIGEDLFLAPEAARVDYDMNVGVLDRFRQVLKARYTSVPLLNKAWETHFRRWDEVLPMTAPGLLKREQARRKPSYNFAPFIEFREHMESEFAAFITELLAGFRSETRGTPVGLVGGWMPTVFGGYDWRKIAPFADFIIPEDIDDNRDFLSSFGAGRRQVILTRPSAAPEDVSYSLWRHFFEGDRGAILESALFSVPPEKKAEGEKKKVRESDLEYSVKKIADGLGKLYSYQNRIPDVVGIYYSPESARAHYLIDALGGGDLGMGKPAAGARATSTYLAYRLIWKRILEDLGFAPTYVDANDLLSGRLNSRIRVLVLSKTVCLSDEETEALKQFAAGGGLIFADSYTGIMDSSGRVRGRSPFDLLLGVRRGPRPLSFNEAARAYSKPEGQRGKPRYEKTPGKLAGMFEGADVNSWDIVDTSLHVLAARAYLRMGRNSAILYKQIETGGVVYLNLSLLNYPAYANKPLYTKNISQVIQALLNKFELRPLVAITREGKQVANYKYYLYRDPNVLNMFYLCVIANEKMKPVSGTYLREPEAIDGEGVKVQLPGSYHVYDVNTGEYIGYVDSFELGLSNSRRAAIFSLLPYRVGAFNLQAGVSGRRVLSYLVELTPQGSAAYGGMHVVRLEVYDPQGRLRREYSLNLALTRGRGSGALQLAVSDPPGTWQVKATDVATGVAKSVTFTLSSEFEPVGG